MTPDALAAELSGRLGAPVCRPGGPGDLLDGVTPALVVEPSTVETCAETLRWAQETGRSVMVRGGGTKLGWGASPDTVDLLLSTGAMTAVEAHRHGDLTATIQAGATLAETNRVLGRHRQWLPLDPPGGERATIGGIVSTNDSGPRRQRHGAPRDLIIGMTMVRADGVVAHSGGIVVKNVAGYDLARLLTGAFGSLGVIVNATFKLAPLAEASRTVSVTFPDLAALVPYAVALLERGVTPSALELAAPGATMLARFESVEAVASDQAAQAVTLAADHGGTAVVLQQDDEAAAWRAHEAVVFDRGSTVVKMAVVPAELQPTLAWLDTEVRARSLDYALIGRAGLGVLDLALDGPVADQASLLDALRARTPPGQGSAVVRHATPEIKSLVDVWGPIGDSVPVMRAVKRQFDPENRLNPGRGPGNL